MEDPLYKYNYNSFICFTYCAIFTDEVDFVRQISRLDSSGSTKGSSFDSNDQFPNQPNESDKQLRALRRTLLWEIRSDWENLGIELNIPEGTRKVIMCSSYAHYY